MYTALSDVLVSAQVQDVEEGYEATTTVGGGALASAAPQPDLVPHLPPFPVLGPPESVTVSIIVENNDNFRQYCPTSVQGNNDGDNIDWNDLLICLSRKRKIFANQGNHIVN